MEGRMNQQADTRRQGAELTAVLTILSVDGAEACRNGRRQHHQRQQQRRRGLLHPANHRRRAMRCTSAGAPSSILSGRGDDSCSSSSSLSAVARLATKRRKRGCASQVVTCTNAPSPPQVYDPLMLPLHYSCEEEVKPGGVGDEEAGRRGHGDGVCDGRDGVCNRQRRGRVARR